MGDGDLRVEAEPLQAFMAEVFERAGMPAGDAAVEAEVLVWANLRGIDSHGVQRIASYLGMIDSGEMNVSPNIKILKESPAVLYMDADRALGPVPTVRAMDAVIEKARNIGIGWALIRNLTHQGAMGYYALRAAGQGMAGIAIVCSPPNMAPYGASAPGLHNSPISIAVPANRAHPVVLDMATSIAAGGKLQVAIDQRATIPDTWALDGSGTPTTDPNIATTLMPSGGPKGSGLAMIFQCLTSLMAANPLCVPVLRGEPKRHNQNSVVAAIDISFFCDVDEYGVRVDDLVDELKALRKADGVDEILMPGEPEFATLEERSANGIPIPIGTVEKLREAAERFRISSPV